MTTLLHYFSLEHEVEDFEKIHESIEQGIIFRGTNLWILVFAIIVASVGLNMNSTAVVIGAMLISPLMGPINGMGYSIATYDFRLLRRAIKNFTFAVCASLFASTIYFAISPVSTAHSELLARTTPTIYDVLIALFGGLAGIVATASRNKGNVLPGVAIATALMPPLCTAGYGLASGQFSYFFGAIYLFTINTVFIALSAVAISQILKFPIRTIVDDTKRRTVNHWITAVIVITVIPSIYFGYGLVRQEKFLNNASRFTNNVSIVEGNYLLKNEINPVNRTITLVYGGNSLDEDLKNHIREKAKDFSLDEADVIIQQGLSFSEITKSGNEIGRLKAEINRLTLQLAEQERQKDSATTRVLLGRQLLLECRALYPAITSCTFAESAMFDDTASSPRRGTIVVLTYDGKPLTASEKQHVTNWLQARLNTGNVKAYFEARQPDSDIADK